MLNVPNSVKSLFQTDGVLKNFRVHFPNGELADITNDNVVSESVKFTESLCSQSTFKFGLAEASVLEFETVGIGNMYGMTIEASIEIDCSSLSAADKATIAAGTWDGTWDSVNEAFGIPLGTFRVENCPRNHGAMAHRQVTAYSLSQKNKAPKYEQFKLQVGSVEDGKYTPSVQNLFYELINDEALLLNNGYTKTQIAPSFINYNFSAITVQYIPVTADQPYKMTVTGQQGTYYGIQLEFTGSTRHFVPGNNSVTWRYGVPKDALYSLEIGDIGNWIDDIATFIDSTLLIDYEKLQEFGYSTLKDYLMHYISTIQPIISIAPSLRMSYGTEYPLNPQPFPLDDDIPLFYPYLNNTQLMSVCLPDSISLIERGSHSTVVDSNTFNFTSLYGSDLALYEFQTAATNSPIAFESTGQRTYRINTDDYLIKTFVNSYDIQKLIVGFLEIIAEFGKADRFGGMEIFRLDNTSPLSVLPSEYSEMWWDEYDIDPVGTVFITYIETSTDGTAQESTTGITISSGASQYDMSDNEVLKALTNLDLTSVTSLIVTNFAPNTGAVAFTPTELTMQGLPWLEAGDALEIEAEDGTVVETYALRVEMSGIQHLQSVITAEGGEIIEEVS